MPQRQPRIFLSYRRDDVPHLVDRLAERLRSKFGRDAVFQDIACIEPGADWARTIVDAVGHCDALLLVIGPKWRAPKVQPQGAESVPEDFVLVEIQEALRRGEPSCRERRVPPGQGIPVRIDRSPGEKYVWPGRDRGNASARILCRRLQRCPCTGY